MLEFSAPFNWCDRNCERCPLSAGCPIYAQNERNRARSVVEVVQAMFEEGLALCREELQARGLALDELPTPPPPSLDQRLLLEASRRYVCSLRAHMERDPEIRRLGMLSHMKVARIASELDDVDGPDWQVDTLPNLLLLERTLDALRAALGDASEVVRQSEQELRALLAPMFRAIPEVARIALRVFAEAGRAPSPFVTVRLRRPSRE
jgi:hypothetical protein